MILKLLNARLRNSFQESIVFALPKVKVKVNQGIVKGVIESLPNGKKFQRFSGIPFAKPPINELRFRAPQKLLKFDQNEIDCTREGDMSFQFSGWDRKYVGSENCLNLNVYAPADVDSSKKLAVMVFIHGGGFKFDSNRRDFYSPEYLLMKDVVVVTVNYRFGALGFAKIPSKGIEGNATLKDQQMALEWVYENISQFGGDSENICLFGESAGAACVHLHILNDRSKKFIKSAILQSNVIQADWFIQKDVQQKTKQLARVLGASSESDDDVYNALMSATVKDIYSNEIKVQDPDQIRRCLPFVFKPSIEEQSDGAFITQSPLETLKNRKIDVPVIIGINDGDGMTMVSAFRKKLLPSFNNDYVRFLPLSLNIDSNSEEAQKVGRKVKEFYFQDKSVDNTTLPQFTNFMTDMHFSIPHTLTYELHSMYQKSDQFLYEFRYDGELNGFKSLLQMNSVPGACHFDELFYLFEPKILRLMTAKDSSAWKMRETMCNLWTNFAKHKNPTPDDQKSLSVKWKPAVKSSHKSEKLDIDYLKIDKNIEMSKNMYEDRLEFWRNIYQEYNGSFHNPKF